MRYLNKLLFVGVCLALLVVLAVPVFAQDLGPGEGAPVIWPNFGGDIQTLNPILAQDGSSARVINRIYPRFLNVDINTGNFAPGIPDQIVDTWTISDDGTVYTFTLRDDFVWSDGTPITSADVKYVWDAIQDPSLEASGNLTALKGLIVSVEAPDPQTVVMTFTGADCNALNNAATFRPVPAHAFNQLYGTDYSLMNDSDYNLNPTVTSGAFSFLNFRPGEQVTLAANQDFPDSPVGYVVPEGWIDKVVTNQTVAVEQFLAGDLAGIGAPQNRQAELQALVDAGTYQGFNSFRANYRFIAFNMADPTNPQPGLDEEGNVIDQGHHPILGDVRVRQALNYAMQFDELNQGSFGGFGIQGATHSRPDNWAHPADMQPYPFDLEMAKSLLEEAGWKDNDGDGIRECDGCLYADPGTPLAFSLKSNVGNTSQEAFGAILTDQWGEVGVDLDFQLIDFNVLVEELTAQTFDAMSIFWGFDFPADPNGELRGTFGLESDVPASGFNVVSFANERFNQILEETRALPGCDQDTLIGMYGEAYQILHDESPWIWVGGAQTLTVAQTNVNGFAPNDRTLEPVFYNAMAWEIAP
jgi:peptide/nickel transport system substrate-binding protein